MRGLHELDELFFTAGKNLWPAVNERAFRVAEKFLNGHAAKSAAVFGVNTNVVDNADADFVSDVALDFGAGARLHADFEREIGFAKSAIDNFSRGGSGLRQDQRIFRQVFHRNAAPFAR